MQNAMNKDNINSTANNWSNKAQNQIEKGLDKAEASLDKASGKAETVFDKAQAKAENALASLKGLSADDIRTAATDFGGRVRDASADAFRDPVSFVKRHPVGTAIGAAAFGLVVGMLATRRSRD
jgi:ElaB/YqjD/DUF883 family membrane-anchored ribosome-binding protein